MPYVTAAHDRDNPAAGRMMRRIGMICRYSCEEEPKNIKALFRMHRINLGGPTAPLPNTAVCIPHTLWSRPCDPCRLRADPMVGVSAALQADRRLTPFTPHIPHVTPIACRLRIFKAVYCRQNPRVGLGGVFAPVWRTPQPMAFCSTKAPKCLAFVWNDGLRHSLHLLRGRFLVRHFLPPHS